MADVDSAAAGGGGATSGDPPSFKLFGKLILTEETHQVAPSSPPSDKPKSSPEQESAAAAREAAPPLPCPRCKSTETKFCYFNNYNVNQPRHFCRACHRYWTAGGALRNVPVGAGRRRGRQVAAAAASAGCGSSGDAAEVGRWLLRPDLPAKRRARGMI